MNDVIDHDQSDSETTGGAGMLVTSGGLSTMVRAEIDMQITTARAYPRRPSKVRDSLIELVTLDEAAAVESMYALPRGGKPVTGPSIRFAESVKQAWGNCRASTEVSEVNKSDKYVEAVGIFHDLETNTVTRITHRRRISTSKGKLFADDMIMVTANAACSVAMRESILKGVPKPVWRAAYEAVLKVIAGDVMTLAVNREKAIRAFAVYGVKPEQVFGAIGVLGEADITLEHITVLRGMFSALKNQEETVESMFAKREKETDPNYNPLVREKTDPTTGEVTSSDSISTGGSNEVPGAGGAEADGQRVDSSVESASTNTAKTANDHVGEKQANDSAAAEAGHPSGHAAGHQPAAGSDSPATNKASDTPAPSDAGTSAAGGGSSSQPDLLSGTTGSSAQSTEGQAPATEGTDGSRGGTTPSVPDRLKSYNKALSGIENGGPPKLAKQGDAWAKKWGAFEGAAEKKRAEIYTAHLNRLTGSTDMAACQRAVEEIISK